jgi:glycerol uptake facilitator protein
MPHRVSLFAAARAEFIGTFILVLFGNGAVHVAVLTGELVGLWPVAFVWGLAVAMAIYAVSAISGSHINPAITLTFATYDGFPWRRVPAYVVAQVAGAFAASGVLYGLFGGLIRQYESSKQIVRGAPGSELTAMLYDCNFPHPAAIGTSAAALSSITWTQAMGAEILGTALLAFLVFAFVDRDNPHRPFGALTAPFIGLAVTAIVCLIAPLTQAALNPARDFGPRLFAYFAGWDAIAIPGPRGGFFSVYILAPTIGALVGAGAYRVLIKPSLPADEHPGLWDEATGE